MKKLFAIAVSAVLVAGLALGCTQNTNSNTTETKTDAQVVNFEKEPTSAPLSLEGLKGTKEDGSPIKIGFSIAVNDQYGSILSTAFINKANDVGASVKLVEAKENDTQMLNQIQQFIAEQTDVIVVQVTNTKIPQQIMDIAGKVPVVFLNRLPLGDIQGPAYYVGSDDNVAGQLQGEALANFFKDSGKKELQLVQFMGELGLANTNARTEGVKKVLESKGFKVEYAYQDTAKWSRTNATNQMQTFLGTGKAYDAVSANNDEMAIGAILAMKSKNVDFAKVPVVGVDATKDGLIAVQDGDLYATVYQDAQGQGEGALAVCLAVVNGKEAPRNVDIPFVLVTKDNVKDFMK